MGQKTILSKYQRELLDLVTREPYLLRNYYWTGGTALAEIYLHHRESYDIDLFVTENEVHVATISKFVSRAGRELGVKKTVASRYLGLYSFIFTMSDDSQLKIDFNYYPFERIESGKKYQGLSVDSLVDIATNKVHTIFMKPRGRDYIDLYFILKLNPELRLEKLVSFANAKFDWHVNPLQLGENFLKASAFTDMPKVFLPFDQKEVEKFYIKLARELKPEILK